jgi:hypothetical protein
MPISHKISTIKLAISKAACPSLAGGENFSMVFAYDTGTVRFRTIRIRTVKMDMGQGKMLLLMLSMKVNDCHTNPAMAGLGNRLQVKQI